MYQIKPFLIASFCFHLLILASIIFYFVFTLTSINEKTNAVETYTYQEVQQTIAPKPNTSNIKSEKSLIPNKKKTALASSHSALPASITIPKQENTKDKHALLTLLHEAIQKHQHYPLSAQEMEQQGRTSIQFTLYQSGKISDLRITKSAGINSLDQAALAAVQAAAPFQGIEAYLQQAETFNIDVIFEY